MLSQCWDTAHRGNIPLTHSIVICYPASFTVWKNYIFATVLHWLNSSPIFQSSKDGEATGRHHAKFWQEVDPIKCVKSHINKIIIHEFQGEQSEFAFVKFIAKRARKLQTLVLVLTEGTFASVGELYEVNSQLRALTRWSWAAEGCEVLLVGPKLDCTWNFARASDLSVKDPFWWWTWRWLHLLWCKPWGNDFLSILLLCLSISFLEVGMFQLSTSTNGRKCWSC